MTLESLRYFYTFESDVPALAESTGSIKETIDKVYKLRNELDDISVIPVVDSLTIMTKNTNIHAANIVDSNTALCMPAIHIWREYNKSIDLRDTYTTYQIGDDDDNKFISNPPHKLIKCNRNIPVDTQKRYDLLIDTIMNNVYRSSDNAINKTNNTPNYIEFSKVKELINAGGTYIVATGFQSSAADVTKLMNELQPFFKSVKFVCNNEYISNLFGNICFVVAEGMYAPDGGGPNNVQDISETVKKTIKTAEDTHNNVLKALLLNIAMFKETGLIANIVLSYKTLKLITSINHRMPVQFNTIGQSTYMLDIINAKYELVDFNVKTIHDVYNVIAAASVGSENQPITLDFLFKRIDGLKRQLFVHKRFMDTMDNVQYDKINDLARPSRYIKKKIKLKYNLNVSQAFCKMLEILYMCPVINDDTHRVKTFHLCEAPGQFILSFISYCNRHKIQYDWYAQSLNHNNETVQKKYPGALDDRYGLIRKYPNRWLYGADDTGDVTSLENIKSYSHVKYDVITSDCGLSVSGDDYGKQEEVMVFINYCQMMIGILSLKVGGTFIYKAFLPFSTKASLSSLCLLYDIFEHLHIVKPSLNPASSEVYVFARGFLGLSDKMKDRLFECHSAFTADVEIQPITQDKLLLIYLVLVQCIQKNVYFLQRNAMVYYYKNDRNKVKTINDQEINAAKWISKFLPNNNINL
jgi:hypothetical protein